MSELTQTSVEFVSVMTAVTGAIDANVPGPDLETRLNRDFAAGRPWLFRASELCQPGIADRWLWGRKAGGIKFGRPVKNGEATHGMSVGVVEMDNVVGPHHAYPHGVIDLVLPVDATAEFDGCGAGWKVSGPGSAPRPTVAGGKAIVHHLFPEGAIEFTRG